MRFIWLLFSENNSLWAKWQKQYIIGTKSFWEIEVSAIHSWLWKSILQLRPLAAIFLRTNVADGRNTQFWWDSWTPFGPLIQYLGYSGPSRLRLPLNASVAAGVRLASWGLNITTLCCLCAVANETRGHVLLSCVYSREIWKLILLRLDPVRNLFSSWAELLSWLRQGSSAAPRTLRSVVAQA
ncbi:hypothetical protein F2Q69_00048526, partial [Brassica cretica]